MSHSSADSKERFSSRVAAYVAARPQYPRAALDHLKSAIGLVPDWHIADIGAGTGISTKFFLENGNPVTAVEPNAAMRQAAEQSLAGFAKFKSVNASAEATTLPDSIFDLIVAAQAFHWFDHAAAKAEFRRILKPSGYVLLMWNARRLTGVPFLDAYEKLLLTYGTDYLKIRHQNVTDQELAPFFSPHGHTRAAFPNYQTLDFEALCARVLSSSYMPQAGDARYEPMLSDLRQIFRRHHHAGHVTIEYETELFYGRP